MQDTDYQRPKDSHPVLLLITLQEQGRTGWCHGVKEETIKSEQELRKPHFTLRQVPVIHIVTELLFRSGYNAQALHMALVFV